MEWLKEIIKKNVLEEGKVDTDILIKNISSELPKYMIPKDSFNGVNEQLKKANSTIEDLKKDSEKNVELQNELKKYKDNLEAKEKEIEIAKKEDFLRNEFRKAGAKESYIDLLMKTSKLDGIEEVKGEFVGVDKLVNNVKESYNDLFSNESIDNNNSSTYQYEPVNGESDIDAELNNIESIIL